MEYKVPAWWLAGALATVLLAGCQAREAVPAPTPSPAATAAPVSAAPSAAEPTPTPQPVVTPEPTPAVDLNKTYTLEQLKQNSSLRALLQQYGTVCVDMSSNGDPQWEITQLQMQYKLDENGYLQKNVLAGTDPTASTASSFGVQDDPNFAYVVSWDPNIGEKHLTFYDMTMYNRPLDFPWYGDDPVFEVPATPVITDTHAEEGQIVVTVSYEPEDGSQSGETQTFYVDPVTDLVMQLVTESSGTLGGEIDEPRRTVQTLTLGGPFDDWSSLVQSVTNAEDGLSVTCRVLTASMDTAVDRPMKLTTNTYLGTSADKNHLYILSKQSLGDEPGLRYHPTAEGQLIMVYGGP